MARQFRSAGPQGGQLFTHPQPDINARGIFDSQYGLPGTQFVRVATARDITIDFFPSDEPAGCSSHAVAAEEALKICQIINAKAQKDGKPPISEESFVQFQVTFGPQITYHQPVNRLPLNDTAGSNDDRGSAESDFTLQAAANLNFHRGKKAGVELTVALQGSYNLLLLDPTHGRPDDPDAFKHHASFGQGQLQLQAAYVFNEFKLFGITMKLSALLQIAGAMTYQYDPTANKMLLSYTKQLSGGIGLEIPVADWFSITSQVTVGGTGPASNVTGFQTVDPTFFLGGQIKF